ncbi:60S ribosomal protein L33B [Oleoguttula sp. CCFEE 5521]
MPSEQGHRLYVKYVHHTSANTPFNTGGNTPTGKHLSYQRGKRNTNPNTSLIKIEGVDDPKAATFYNGKRIAYVYRGKKEIRGTKIRVIWGKVTRPHGMC